MNCIDLRGDTVSVSDVVDLFSYNVIADKAIRANYRMSISVFVIFFVLLCCGGFIGLRGKSSVVLIIFSAIIALLILILIILTFVFVP